MSGQTGPLETLRQEPEWSACFDRVATALDGKAAPVDDPGKPLSGPESCLETYARAVSLASSPGISVALTLPMALTVGSVAGQGAYWARVPLDGGHKLEVPMILQSTLIAPSGYGKSTALEPLVGMLDRLDRQGHTRRSKIVLEKHAKIKKALEDAGDPGLGDAELEKIRVIHMMGKCKRLTLDSGTPEGVRRTLLRGGGCTGILTAEPDILQEIGKYTKDGVGTFRYMLDGWGGSKIGVARGEREMVIPRASLPYCIVVQPVAFEQFNAPKDSRSAGLATDSAIGRGLYGRSWLVRVNGFVGVTAAFGLNGGGGASIVGGVVGAGLAVEQSLEKMLIRSDPYRAAMGVLIGWEEASSQDKESVMKPPGLPERIWLELGKDAEWSYLMVQNMRLALIELVQQMDAAQPGAERLFMPMVSRWTQHVLRLAMVLALSVDAATVDIPDWAIRDAALRLGPWLIEHWAAEMHRYSEASTTALLEQEVKNNPRGLNLTAEGRLIAAMVEMRLASDIDDPADMVWNKAEVFEAVKSTWTELTRPQLTNRLNGAFNEMIAKGWIELVVTSKAGTKGGRPPKNYKRTKDGIAAGL